MTDSQETTICPCCGQPVAAGDYKFNQAQVDHYLACTMTGIPYWREYPLFNGAVRITIQHIPVKQGIKMQYDITNLLAQLGIEDSQLVPAIRYNIVRRLAVPQIILQPAGVQPKVYMCAQQAKRILQQLRTGSRTLTADTSRGKAQQLLQLMQDVNLFSGVEPSILQRVTQQHTALYQWILTRSTDENFWDSIKQR